MQPSINYTFEGSNDNKFMGKAHYVVPEREYLSKSPHVTRSAVQRLCLALAVWAALFLLLGNAAEYGFKKQDISMQEYANCDQKECWGIE